MIFPGFRSQLSGFRFQVSPPVTRYPLLLLASSNISKYFRATASRLRSASIFFGPVMSHLFDQLIPLFENDLGAVFF